MSGPAAVEPIGPTALAESLSAIWSVLHADATFGVSNGEVHYLRAIALGVDDDLVSHMLLKKLKLARVHDAAALANVVRMNSFVEYRVGDQGRRFRQLVHPTSLHTVYGLSVASLEGAGIVGMRAGQTILWPDSEGTLADLHVLRVESGQRPRDLATTHRLEDGQ